jgi:hypothetical protein
MNPEETLPNLPNLPSSPDGGRFSKRLLLLGLGVVVIIALGVVAYFNQHQTTGNHPTTAAITPDKLSITSTDPDVASVTTLTQSLAINFNLPLTAGSATVTASPQIISSTSITGKTLTLTLTPKTLLDAKTYTITIKSISSTSGKSLTNKQITFVPAYSAPTTSGQEALSNVGLSDDQVSSLYTYLSKFNLWAQNVAVDPATVRHFRENPADAWSPWAVSFTVNIDGTNYKAVTDYFDTEHIRIKLSNLANQQVYTAGDPGSY